MRRLLLLFLLLVPGVARAQQSLAWTRDQGHVYVNLSYSRISAGAFYATDYHRRPEFIGDHYTQDSLDIYGEIGLISRWLTTTIDWQGYRRQDLRTAGYVEGVGDLRLGLWTGVLTMPLRLSFGLILGVPTGDKNPEKGLPPDAAPGAGTIAAALPTGTGEFNLEGVAALGYSFGGFRRWPLQHYIVASLGYFLRTRGYSDSVTYKVELGIKLPWRVIDRFWFIGRLYGLESFISSDQLSPSDNNCANTGLCNGTTYDAYGFEIFGRIWKGLGASFAYSSAYRARLEPSAGALRVSLSYDY